MKTTLKLFIISIIAITFNACIISGGVQGSRNVTSESRTLNDSFEKIEVSQGIDVILTQSKEYALTVEADDNLHNLLMTEVKDGTLKIYFKENVGQRKESKVYLDMPSLSGINTNSGASVTGKNTFELDKLSLDASSGSEIEVRVQGQEIKATTSSGSDITLTGDCKSLFANSSSGSDIDAKGLTAQEVEADASSGADIDVFCTERFVASASSGASISSDGNPKITDLNKSSGGSVSVK